MSATPAAVEDEVGPTDDAQTPIRSFDAVYGAEWHGLVALGWSLTGSWAAAEELVQDAFADAYRRWDEVGRLDRPGAWVRRAIVNRSASHGRRRSVERRGVLRLAGRAEAEADGPQDDRTGDDGVARVQDPDFWAALRALPDRQRACLALHYLDDLPVAEIAHAVGCSAATVKVHLHRGRAALAERLAHLDLRDPADGPTTEETHR